MQIKHKHILVPGQRYQDSRHFIQNPKVPKNVMGFNNHAQRSTPPYYLDVDWIQSDGLKVTSSAN